jgi:glycogen phosphorylase
MNDITSDRPVAYFCAEFGLQAGLPLYAGGLGVLAGDTVKEAADQNFPMVAVGLLYRGGKARQQVDESGWQTEVDVEVDPLSLGFEHVYVPDADMPLFVKVHLSETNVWARIWKRTVNRTTLYLLDTETDQNEPEERSICKALYSGSDEQLIKQQMVLGIGGVKALTALGIKPFLYHVNEGRPAFIYWQLIRQLMESGMTFQLAKESAKKQIVYTNHTLVRAGNQSYDPQNIGTFARYYAERMGITLDELLSEGMEETTHKFNVTRFALNVSRKASAVSQVHYELSKTLWPEYNWVGITNGVHMPTWQDSEIVDCEKQGDALWYTHMKKKQELADFVAQKTGFSYDPERLVLAWARRITGYKRLHSLFDDLDKLVQIIKDEKRPVQLLVAGKAHASDTSAKHILQNVIAQMKGPLSGHALFIPDYDIEVANHLVKGSDVWVNTPILGQEASGTSGMKAIANGVLQLTVEDGWAAEVDWHGVGWTLDSNHLDETFYFRLKEDIVPEYYERDDNGVSQMWLSRMKRSVELADTFSTTRMLNEYREKLYEATFL